MSGKDHPRRLVVEGYEDLYVVRGLMRFHIDWPETKDEDKYPVFIDRGGSVDEILNKHFLDVLIKSKLPRILGIMIDADREPAGRRYRKLRGLCGDLFPEMPLDMPSDGLIVNGPADKRLGAWIMPDNKSPGDLETFLRGLVPNTAAELMDHAERSTALAKEKFHAPFHDVHNSKANLHTWLSWQDPPAQNPGKALDSKALDPTLLAARPFVAWFRNLYGS